jgi:hypothetical protein
VILREEAERAAHTAVLVSGQLRAAGWQVNNQPMPLVDLSDEMEGFDQRLERPLDWERQMDSTLRLVQNW